MDLGFLGIPATLVELTGAIIVAAGEITDNETLVTIGETIVEHADTIAE